MRNSHWKWCVNCFAYNKTYILFSLFCYFRFELQFLMLLTIRVTSYSLRYLLFTILTAQISELVSIFAWSFYITVWRNMFSVTKWLLLIVTIFVSALWKLTFQPIFKCRFADFFSTMTIKFFYIFCFFKQNFCVTNWNRFNYFYDSPMVKSFWQCTMII